MVMAWLAAVPPGFDTILDVVGGEEIDRNLQAVAQRGSIVQVGLMGAPVEISPFDMTMRDVTLRGSLNYPLTVWPRIFAMIRSGLYPVDDIVDGVIAMDDVVKDGFLPLLDKAGAKMKILVSMER